MFTGPEKQLFSKTKISEPEHPNTRLVEQLRYKFSQ